MGSTGTMQSVEVQEGALEAGNPTDLHTRNQPSRTEAPTTPQPPSQVQEGGGQSSDGSLLLRPILTILPELRG